MTPAEVDVMLERWRESAGENWQSVMRKRLENYGQEYVTGNPIHAWNAVLICRLLEESPPEWVMDYLAICAARIHDLLMYSSLPVKNKIKPNQIARASRPAKNKITPNQIARAFGLVTDGRGTAFTEYWDSEWLDVAFDVKEYLDAGDKLEFAYETVTANYKAKGKKMSATTARRCWKRLEGLMSKSGLPH